MIKSETGMAIAAICMGCFLVGFSIWQWHIGEVFLKNSDVTLGQGWPFLIAEIGLGVYIGIKGVRSIRSGCWPPPPL